MLLVAQSVPRGVPSDIARSRANSESAINAGLRRMGYDTKTEVIEHQLAHAVSDSLGTAYNHTEFLKERKL